MRRISRLCALHFARFASPFSYARAIHIRKSVWNELEELLKQKKRAAPRASLFLFYLMGLASARGAFLAVLFRRLCAWRVSADDLTAY